MIVLMGGKEPGAFLYPLTSFLRRGLLPGLKCLGTWVEYSLAARDQSQTERHTGDELCVWKQPRGDLRWAKGLQVSLAVRILREGVICMQTCLGSWTFVFQLSLFQ